MSAAVRVRRKPSSRYHHGDLRRALITEGLRTIAAGGVEALTLREVGRRLGVSRSALYRHFSDKSALLAAVAREGFQTFASDLRLAWARDDGTPEGLHQMGMAYVAFALAHPSHYRVMFGSDFPRLCEKDPDLQGDAAASFDVLVQALGSLQAAGLVRRDDLLLQAQFVWSIVHGIARLAIDGQLGPAAAEGVTPLVELALERLRTGIGAAGGAG